MRKRETLNSLSPQGAIDKFKRRFIYNSSTGEIVRIDNGREYKKTDKKGYRRSIYCTFNSVEYRFTYHRFCWFLYYGEFIPDNMTIDHIDLVYDNNKIKNLQILSNDKNSLKKKLVRKNNLSGYKGVSVCNELHHKKGERHIKYIASISVNKKTAKIGRFKDPILAAKYYDSANRYYYKEMSHPNFEEVFIKPMSIENLRDLKSKHTTCRNTSK